MYAVRHKFEKQFRNSWLCSEQLRQVTHPRWPGEAENDLNHSLRCRVRC